eukprot:NODE_349_length_8994_cov_1.235526.p3 type:complete len:280 gc:universal NODE_349_length_8994_cov_1.235526:3625-4464(+)
MDRIFERHFLNLFLLIVVSKMTLSLPSFKNIHKGSHGRIAIIGGSRHYTGAPFFSGIASLKTGADLCSILTHREAMTPIKSYSPDLMVSDVTDAEHRDRVLLKAHAVVLGPGLSRDNSFEVILDSIKPTDTPVIIDADGIFFYKPGLFKNVVLTPNVNEYKQLVKRNSSAVDLARELRATILLKGENDQVITKDGITTIEAESAPRRCGGQGDLLTGILATLCAWNPNNIVECCEFASKILRKAANLAYENSSGRSLISSDIVNYIGQAFEIIFPEDQI